MIESDACLARYRPRVLRRHKEADRDTIPVEVPWGTPMREEVTGEGWDAEGNNAAEEGGGFKISLESGRGNTDDP